MKDFLLTASLISVACSAICKVFEFIASKTEGKKDDVAVARVRTIIDTAQKFLAYPAMNPKQKK